MLVAVELHEHQVPDFDVAIALGFGRARRPARDLRTVVVEHLAAGTTGTRIGHLPEIVRSVRCALVVSDAHDPFARQTDVVRPGAIRLVVGVVDGGPQPVGRQLVDRRQELPRVADRIALEVIAERPISEHFEEGAVSRGVTDILQVVMLASGAQAALHVGRAHVAALVGPKKDLLELHHPAVGEEQRGIIGRHQRRRRNDRMSLRGEVFEEMAADVGGFHGRRRFGETDSQNVQIQYVSIFSSFSPPQRSISRSILKIADKANPRACRKRTWRAFSRSVAGAAPKRRCQSACIATVSSGLDSANAAAMSSPSIPFALSVPAMLRRL